FYSRHSPSTCDACYEELCSYCYCCCGYNCDKCNGRQFGALGVISMGSGRRYCSSYTSRNISARILLYSYNSYSPHRIYCVDRLFLKGGYSLILLCRNRVHCRKEEQREVRLKVGLG